MRQTQANAKLTKTNPGQVSKMDVALPTKRVKRASHTIAVETDEHANKEEHRASCPAKKGHNQERVAKNEGIVQTGDKIEPNCPWVVCKQHKLS